MVGKVEALLKNSLLKSRKGMQSTSSASVPDADSILAKLLCEKLQQAAIDKQAAIFELLDTHVVSPLFEKILPEVVGQALSGQLQKQMLKAAELVKVAEELKELEKKSLNRLRNDCCVRELDDRAASSSSSTACRPSRRRSGASTRRS